MENLEYLSKTRDFDILKKSLSPVGLKHIEDVLQAYERGEIVQIEHRSKDKNIDYDSFTKIDFSNYPNFASTLSDGATIVLWYNDKEITKNLIDEVKVVEKEIIDFATNCFTNTLETMGFSLVKEYGMINQDDGDPIETEYYRLIDNQGEGFADVEEKCFLTAADIMECFNEYINDYYLSGIRKDFEKAFPNVDTPTTCKEWANLALSGQFTSFIKEYKEDFATLDMLVNYIGAVDLDEVIVKGSAEIDFSNTLDSNFEAVAEDGIISVPISNTLIEKLANRTQLFNETHTKDYKDLICNTDVTLYAYADISEEGELNIFLTKESNATGFKTYAIPLLQDEKRNLLQLIGRTYPLEQLFMENEIGMEITPLNLTGTVDFTEDMHIGEDFVAIVLSPTDKELEEMYLRSNISDTSFEEIRNSEEPLIEVFASINKNDFVSAKIYLSEGNSINDFKEAYIPLLQNERNAIKATLDKELEKGNTSVKDLLKRKSMNKSKQSNMQIDK